MYLFWRALFTSKNEICPSKVATATSCPSGLKATHVPSDVSSRDSCADPFSIASQIRKVLSQDTEASTVLVIVGLNAKLHYKYNSFNPDLFIFSMK